MKKKPTIIQLRKTIKLIQRKDPDPEEIINNIQLAESFFKADNEINR